NVSQLRSVAGALGAGITNINNQINQLGNRINDVSDRADAGTAAAMATAGLPQAYLPGKSMVAVAGSTYRGKQGYAVGFSAITDGGNWIIKGSVNGNTRGQFGATVGAGYQW
ncbi:MAG: YadA-like family protein, partial [Alysiella sp.]|uniref:YadA-like family protein n=1 Tax=Alysiella sp. TaxID=1872483 RepID=UPI0026DC8BAF